MLFDYAFKLFRLDLPFKQETFGQRVVLKPLLISMTIIYYLHILFNLLYCFYVYNIIQMNCKCYKDDDRSFREKLKAESKSDNSNSTSQKQKVKKVAPLGMKVLNALGLKEYILNKLVFKKLPASTSLFNQLIEYKFVAMNSRPNDRRQQLILINNRQTLQIEGYQIIGELLEQNELSVPAVWIKLKSEHWRSKPTIIYSHGNSSDISDSFLFIQKLSRSLRVNYIIYDYTGYGISSESYTTENSICEDLQLVMRWVNVPKEDIILWGFSLGSFPTVSIAAKYKFGGVILQSPIASAACFFDQQAQQQYGIDSHYTYDIDCLDNLKNIGSITSPIVIFHSTDDQIIPIQHANRLYQIIKQEKKAEKYSVIQVEKLKHNQMHYFFAQQKQNPLNNYLQDFINHLTTKIGFKHYQKKISKGYIPNNHHQPKDKAKVSPSRKMKESVQKIKIISTKKKQQEWEILENKQLQKSQENKAFILLTKNHKFYFNSKNNV